MSLKIIKADAVSALLNGEINMLAHGVNCSNGFGSGIAKAIAASFPVAKHMYHNKFDSEGWNLTEVQEVAVGDQRMVFNCATQKTYGRDKNVVYAELYAVRHILNHVRRIAESLNQPIGFPLIGAGLGGLNPLDVFDIMRSIFNKEDYNVDATLYLMDSEIYNDFKKRGFLNEEDDYSTVVWN